MHTRDILIDAFGRIRNEVKQAAEGQPAEALAYLPDPGANSIAWLVWHLTRVQDDHMSEIAGRDQAWVTDGWAQQFGMDPDPSNNGYGHTPEQVAAIRPGSPDVLIGYHDAVHQRTTAYLEAMEAEDLDRIIDERWDPPVSVGVRIVSVIDDCMQHTGQANYVRGLFERLG